MFIIFHVSHFTFPVTAQSITWQRLYDGPGNNLDGSYSICKADSNNFYIVGYSFTEFRKIYIIKINQYGDTLWTRLIGTYVNGGPRGLASVSSGDGGCVITGNWDMAFTLKLNSSGEIVWLKDYPGGYIPQLYDIKKTFDGGYIACGRESSENGYVLKVDSLGNFQWFKIYPSSFIKTFRSIELEGTNKYVLAGWITDYPQDSTKAYIVKIDSVGNIIWGKNYKVNTHTSAYKIIKKNNGYVFGGNTLPWGNDDSNRVYIREIDTSGNDISTHFFSSNRKEIFGTFGIFNNKYIIASSVDSAPYTLYGRIRIADTDGNVLIVRNVPTPDYIVFASLVPLSNGDIIFAGEADFDIHPPPGNNDVYALRTDSLLTISPLYGIEKISNSIPINPKLYQNYPNPFNPKTNIKFDISSKTYVKIIFYNILGQKIDEAVNKVLEPGTYLMKWGNDKLSSGFYIYQLITDKLTLSKKMILLK